MGDQGTMANSKPNMAAREGQRDANADRPAGLSASQLQELAERVYELLRAELRIEQERRGQAR
jgi:hypothetical protein